MYVTAPLILQMVVIPMIWMIVMIEGSDGLTHRHHRYKPITISSLSNTRWFERRNRVHRQVSCKRPLVLAPYRDIPAARNSQDTYRAAAARRRRRPGFGFGRSSPATLIFAFFRSLRVPEPGRPWPFFPDGKSSAFLNTSDTRAPWFVVASSGASTAC